MCLNVISGTTRKVAQKDFFMYKWVRADNSSPVRGSFKYEPNKRYKLAKQIISRNREVEAGFHGFITINGARSNPKGPSSRKLIALIVPKGTRYYVGEGNEIASEIVKTITLDDLN